MFELMDRWPEMTRPLRSDSCVIAGVSCTNSVKSRPRICRFDTARAPMIVVVAVSSLSSSGGAAETVTVSVMLATLRLKLIVCVAPTLRRTASRAARAKPADDACTK